MIEVSMSPYSRNATYDASWLQDLLDFRVHTFPGWRMNSRLDGIH